MRLSQRLGVGEFQAEGPASTEASGQQLLGRNDSTGADLTELGR